MPIAAPEHPTAAALKAYGQGRLSPREMSAIEVHLADCGSCCDALAQLPDDTLLLRAREAATSGFRAREHTVAAPPANPREIPQALRDHSRYRVLGLLGAGGMGAVYKAEHRKMERMVALKVINPDLVSSPAALERFEREVKTAAKLLHPNIVTAHDAEQAGDIHFLVMEFVEGASLDRLLAKMGPLAPQQAAHLIRQAALGLQHAHEKGMIHRDLKPQNLMITRSGVVKILDFGLAKFASQAWQSSPETDAADRPEGATRAGAVLGTPDYIAPEQATDAHKADIRADIYSLGCTLYFLLTGEPPFPGGTTFDKLHAHQTCEPTPIRLRRPDVSAEFAAVLERMLAKNPADRFARPADLAKALEPFAKSRGSAQMPVANKSPAASQLPAPTVAAEPDTGSAPLDLPGLDDVITYALPVISKTPSQSPKGKQKPPLAVLAGATLVALLCAAGLLWYATSGDGTKKKSPTPPIATKPAEKGVTGSPAKKPAETSPPVTSPAAIKYRLLLVLPLNNTFFGDYENVRAALEPTQFKLVTAAESIRPAGVGFMSGGEPPDARTVRPDKELKDVKADDYDAIIFIGGNGTELVGQGPAQPHVQRLLKEFIDQGKFISALCAGQHVLAEHGYLRSGRRVAGGQFAQMVEGFRRNNQATIDSRSVVSDDKLITGKLATDGAAFVDALTNGIRNSWK